MVGMILEETRQEVYDDLKGLKRSEEGLSVDDDFGIKAGMLVILQSWLLSSASMPISSNVLTCS